MILFGIYVNISDFQAHLSIWKGIWKKYQHKYTRRYFHPFDANFQVFVSLLEFP